MTEPIIQDALDLAEELQDGDNDYGEERRILLGLCEQVNSWKAMAIEEHAWLNLFMRSRKTREDKIQPDKIDFEASESWFKTEMPKWRKINQSEQDALALAIGTMKSEADLLNQMERMNLGQTRTNVDQLLDAIEVLRRLKE